MKYKNIVEASFIKRPNRFIAHVDIEGKEEIVHVKNTGRMKELLSPGTKVFLEKSDNKKRKTKYDLVALMKGDRLINVDSQITNGVAEEWLKKKILFKNLSYLKREVKYGDSRFDIYLENGESKVFIEVRDFFGDIKDETFAEFDGIVLYMYGMMPIDPFGFEICYAKILENEVE